MQPAQESAKKMPFHSEWPAKIGALANMAATNTAMWMVQNRRHYPAFFFWSGAVAFGIVIACIALSLISTTATQMAVGAVMQAGIGICAVAFLVVLLTMTASTFSAVQHAVRYEVEKWQSSEKALPETVDTWQPLSIAPDTLICLLPGESLATFKKRVQDIQEAHAITHAIWAVVILPFDCEVMVLTPGEPYVFTRGNEPFFDAPQDWAGTVDHRAETVDKYREYVEFFCWHYVRWVTAEKIAMHQKSASQILTEKIAAQVDFSNQ